MKQNLLFLQKSTVYTVDFCRNRRSVNATMERLLSFQPNALYESGLPIEGKKFDDLTQKLLKYIAPICQELYLQLRSDGSTEEVLPHPDYFEDDQKDEEGE